MRRNRNGFTIVELLIVVVVIAILAAIITVAYNGITKHAFDSRVEADAQKAQTAQGLYAVEHGESYVSWYSGSDLPDGLKLNSSGDNQIDIRVSDDGRSYCIRTYNEKSKYSSYDTAYELENKAGACDNLNPSVAALTQNKWKSVVVSGLSTCGLGSDDKVYCWGYKYNTTLSVEGAASAPDISIPATAISPGAMGNQKVRGIWGTGSRICAVAYDNKVYCWGYNGVGGIGDGSTATALTPVAVNTSGVLAGKSMVSVTVGGSGFTCAVDTAGKLYCWGENDNMQLGNGVLTNSTIPVTATAWGLLTNKSVSQVTTGNDHTCVIADGTAYCWGDNGAGHAGAPVSSYVTSAVNISALSMFSGKTIRDISAQGDTTCAATTTGQLYCWGYNTQGQLGINSTTPTHIPTLVQGALAGKSVASSVATYSARCALTTEGRAYCWGSNVLGLLGDESIGTGVNVLEPVEVKVPSKYSSVKLMSLSVGTYVVCGVSDQQRIYCWGYGGYGQKGTGDINGYNFDLFEP